MFRLYKKFSIFSFAKNINNSIHQYLKKRFAKDLSKLIIAILLSLVCPTVYVNTIYGSTFMARSQMSVNKHDPTCEMCFILFFLSFSMKKKRP